MNKPALSPGSALNSSTFSFSSLPQGVHAIPQSCHVIVERPQASHKHGNRFAVHFGIHVPGKEIMVKRDSADHAYEDVYIALKNSFQAARRQLKEHADKIRNH